VPISPAAARPLGIALGVVADAVVADPRRGHPVAGFGRAAAALERRIYADAARPGAGFTAISVAAACAVGVVAERVSVGRPIARLAVTAVATWAVLGSTSLAREGVVMAGLLEAVEAEPAAGDSAGGAVDSAGGAVDSAGGAVDSAGGAVDSAGGAVDSVSPSESLARARQRLSNLCARDPSAMGVGHLARATVESLAENSSDAAVAPLLWGAVAGVPGLLGYRAVNTLDAMVGYTSARYLRFGRASARLDDLVNLVPARVTGLLTVLSAPVVGGSVERAWHVLHRDGARHPSPNAGRPEAATAGALGVVLGGANVYAGRVERRPELGAGGRPPAAADVRRAVRLGRVVVAEAAGLAVGLAALLALRAGRAERALRVGRTERALRGDGHAERALRAGRAKGAL
jgi:adenosylcobinamide-phosphate synthase